jgi:hypothetical protein
METKAVFADSAETHSKIPSSLGLLFFGAYLILLNLTVIYLLLKLWPPTDIKAASGVVRFLPWTREVQLSIELRYLMLAAVAGAAGSCIHLATSFASYLGNSRFINDWGWWYIQRPFNSALLAVLVYLIARGTLLRDGGTAHNLSLYGICALSGLMGMFTSQVTEKLGEVFQTLFKIERPRNGGSE